MSRHKRKPTAALGTPALTATSNPSPPSSSSSVSVPAFAGTPPIPAVPTPLLPSSKGNHPTASQSSAKKRKDITMTRIAPPPKPTAVLAPKAADTHMLPSADPRRETCKKYLAGQCKLDVRCLCYHPSRELVASVSPSAPFDALASSTTSVPSGISVPPAPPAGTNAATQLAPTRAESAPAPAGIVVKIASAAPTSTIELPQPATTATPAPTMPASASLAPAPCDEDTSSHSSSTVTATAQHLRPPSQSQSQSQSNESHRRSESRSSKAKTEQMCTRCQRLERDCGCGASTLAPVDDKTARVEAEVTGHCRWCYRTVCSGSFSCARRGKILRKSGAIPSTKLAGVSSGGNASGSSNGSELPLAADKLYASVEGSTGTALSSAASLSASSLVGATSAPGTTSSNLGTAGTKSISGSSTSPPSPRPSQARCPRCVRTGCGKGKRCRLAPDEKRAAIGLVTPEATSAAVMLKGMAAPAPADTASTLDVPATVKSVAHSQNTAVSAASAIAATLTSAVPALSSEIRIKLPAPPTSVVSPATDPQTSSLASSQNTTSRTADSVPNSVSAIRAETDWDDALITPTPWDNYTLPIVPLFGDAARSPSPAPSSPSVSSLSDAESDYWRRVCAWQNTGGPDDNWGETEDSDTASAGPPTPASESPAPTFHGAPARYGHAHPRAWADLTSQEGMYKSVNMAEDRKLAYAHGGFTSGPLQLQASSSFSSALTSDSDDAHADSRQAPAGRRPICYEWTRGTCRKGGSCAFAHRHPCDDDEEDECYAGPFVQRQPLSRAAFPLWAGDVMSRGRNEWERERELHERSGRSREEGQTRGLGLRPPGLRGLENMRPLEMIGRRREGPPGLYSEDREHPQTLALGERRHGILTEGGMQGDRTRPAKEDDIPLPSLGVLRSRADRSALALVCYDWLGGRCQRGAACKYQHDTALRDMTPRTAALRGPIARAAHNPFPPVAAAPLGLSTPAPAASATAASSSVPLRNTLPLTLRQGRICWEWLRGSCARTRCPYPHGFSECTSFDQALPSARLIRRPPKTEVCMEWLRGRCPWGSDCRWLHSKDVPSGVRVPKPASDNLDVLYLTVLETTNVAFGPGFSIRDVRTDFQSAWVILQHVPDTVETSEIMAALTPFGRITGFKRIDTDSGGGYSTVRACFSSEIQAANVITSLNGALLWDSTLSVRRSTGRAAAGSAHFEDATVRLDWDAPGRIGYAGYTTLKAAESAAAKANETTLYGMNVEATLYEGLPTIGSVNVRFWLPPRATMKDIKSFGPCEGTMLDKPNYMSLNDAFNNMEKIVAQVGDLVTFQGLPPPFVNRRARAWMSFTSPAAAKTTVQYLHGLKRQFLGGSPVYAHHILSLTYTIPREHLILIDSGLEELGRSHWVSRDHSTVKVLPSDSTPSVRLTAQDMKTLLELKSAFEQLLRGEDVRHNGEVVWDDVFFHAVGRAFLRAVEKEHVGTAILWNGFRRTITVHGPTNERRAVVTKIVNKVIQLRNQQTVTIPLPGHLVGVVMSGELLELQRQLGPANVILNIPNRIVGIRGPADVVESAQIAILRALNRFPGERQTDHPECPVCGNDAVLPVTLQCDHTWCKSCLSTYLASAVDTHQFPLTCFGAGGDCSQPISLTTARDLLSADQISALAHSAFFAHVRAHPDDFHHCPTPDCRQVYRTAPLDTVLQCPSCLVQICSTCHREHHEDARCSERDRAQEKLFREWTSAHDVKDCPGCKAPIERSEGCNHMTCIRCQTHICWVCLQTFPRGEGIYDHMRETHGGIGL